MSKIKNRKEVLTVKAIIVLDKKPDVCLDCSACDIDVIGGCKCMVLNQNVKANDRPLNCQIKELPGYKGISPIATRGEKMYSSGWNDCLDAILNTEQK